MAQKSIQWGPLRPTTSADEVTTSISGKTAIDVMVETVCGMNGEQNGFSAPDKTRFKTALKYMRGMAIPDALP